jgi:hypothetical protein
LTLMRMLNGLMPLTEEEEAAEAAAHALVPQPAIELAEDALEADFPPVEAPLLEAGHGEELQLPPIELAEDALGAFYPVAEGALQLQEEGPDPEQQRGRLSFEEWLLNRGLMDEWMEQSDEDSLLHRGLVAGWTAESNEELEQLLEPNDPHDQQLLPEDWLAHFDEVERLDHEPFFRRVLRRARRGLRALRAILN